MQKRSREIKDKLMFVFTLSISIAVLWNVGNPHLSRNKNYKPIHNTSSHLQIKNMYPKSRDEEKTGQMPTQNAKINDQHNKKIKTGKKEVNNILIIVKKKGKKVNTNRTHLQKERKLLDKTHDRMANNRRKKRRGETLKEME